MLLSILKWIIAFLSLMNAGYMCFDGCKALITGDYIRPKTGEYAGQLGPWTEIVEKIGIDPMSTLMKLIFVIYGLIGLIITIAWIMDLPWAWKAMLIFNICSLWNLFAGTMSGGLQIVLLILIKVLK
jgi:hypothetical protein